jgi:hypothetical protein
MFLLLALALTGSSSVLRSENSPPEYAVKAAYLYQFGKFVEWPAQAKRGDAFSICTFGTDPFGAALDQIVAGRTMNGEQIVARHLSDSSDVSQCDILFVARSDRSSVGQVLKMVEGKGILTVGDSAEFITSGGMINFQIDRNKVRFDINLRAMEQVGLKVSSQLLKVARSIRR